MKRRILQRLRRALKDLLQPVVDDLRMHSPLIWGDRGRIAIHPTAKIQNALLNVSSGRITVEESAFFGHNVCLLTGQHDVNSFGVERQRNVPNEGYDITVRQGAWIASNATIIGPCEIGEHAVVAAGSVVTRNVLPYHVVAGVPARIVRKLVREFDESMDADNDPQDA